MLVWAQCDSQPFFGCGQLVSAVFLLTLSHICTDSSWVGSSGDNQWRRLLDTWKLGGWETLSGQGSCLTWVSQGQTGEPQLWKACKDWDSASSSPRQTGLVSEGFPICLHGYGVNQLVVTIKQLQGFNNKMSDKPIPWPHQVVVSPPDCEKLEGDSV